MNKHRLYEEKPKRLITFGCSFTNYHWITWPEILADTIGCDLYNFAMPSNSNGIIHNTIMQADAILDFNPNDLIMICWSGILRDAKLINGRWRRTSIMHNFDIFGEQFLKEMVDPLGYLVETMAFIKSATDIIDNKKSQFHQFSMSGIFIDEAEPDRLFLSKEHELKIRNLYQKYIDRLYPSMCNVLYNAQSGKPKIEQMKVLLGKKDFMDGHPTPDEHIKYINKIFDFEISDETYRKVNDYLPKMYEIMRSIDYSVKEPWAIHHKKLLEYKDKNYIVPNLTNNMPLGASFYSW